MKRIILAFVVLFACGLTFPLAAQQGSNQVLMTVAGEPVSTEEFLNVYLKNNIKGDALDRQSLEEYLDLYINFKLKVKEAEELGLDTAKSFLTELAGYRKQLSQPYLTDTTVEERLLKEAWERSKYDIRASHILIKLDKNAPPADTLKAYQEIIALRKRILKGESFEKVAIEASQDEKVRDHEDAVSKKMVKGNNGDLGYFTVFDVIYPFETAAYNTAQGQVSMPVRTDNGYHLIKVVEKSLALGKITVAHIYFNIPKDATEEVVKAATDRSNEAYDKLKNGAKWEEIVSTYSDDKGSAAKGGQLPAFGVNQIVPEFIDAIKKLKNPGDFSMPVRTSYGWHIIKLIENKAPSSFDNDKAALKNRLIRDKRMNLSKESVLQRVKKENGFKEDLSGLSDFYTVLDSNVFNSTWDVSKAAGLQKVLFTLGGKDYTQADFAKYIATHQPKRVKTELTFYTHEKYNQFVEESLMNLEDSKLESKYPKFRILMKEYRDGILLFELTDQKVWSKAIKDTTGLQAFYDHNKNNYLWDERLDASIYYCKDEATAKAARKLAKVQQKKNYSDQDILTKINVDSIPVLKISGKYFLHKENSLIDNVPWEKAITDNQTIDSSIVFVVVRGIIPPTPKSIREAKGLITADYQNYLEKQWISELRNKYTVQVDKAVFESLIKN